MKKLIEGCGYTYILKDQMLCGSSISCIIIYFIKSHQSINSYQVMFFRVFWGAIFFWADINWYKQQPLKTVPEDWFSCFSEYHPLLVYKGWVQNEHEWYRYRINKNPPRIVETNYANKFASTKHFWKCLCA